MIKNILIAVMAFGISLSASAQENEALARVQKIQGKEVYILNEPVRSYEILKSIKTSPKWMSILTRGVINEHVNDKSAQFVWKASRKLKKQGVDFDALLYVDGKRINAIKFTEEATIENSGIARVKNLKGVNTFVLAEPLNDYSVVKKLYTGVKLIPFLTYGLLNNSIERDIKTLAKKTNKKTDAVNVIYTSGRTGNSCFFQLSTCGFRNPSLRGSGMFFIILYFLLGSTINGAHSSKIWCKVYVKLNEFFVVCSLF